VFEVTPHFAGIRQLLSITRVYTYLYISNQQYTCILINKGDTVQELNEVFESTARYFSVLGEPTRLKILHVICHEEKCVNDIIRATGLLQANVSRHLGLMYQAGLLSKRRDGTQIFYRVAEPLFVELCRSISVQFDSRMDARKQGDIHAFA
jgi:DNA-binding transcriptional ArsR family regulator